MSKWTFLALDAGGASPRLAGCAQSNIVKKKGWGAGLAVRRGRSRTIHGGRGTGGGRNQKGNQKQANLAPGELIHQRFFTARVQLIDCWRASRDALRTAYSAASQDACHRVAITIKLRIETLTMEAVPNRAKLTFWHLTPPSRLACRGRPYTASASGV